MPRYNRNRRSSRKRGKSLAAKAYSLAKKAYTAPELKYNVTTGDIAGPDTTGDIQTLGNITVGTTNNQRIGNSVTAKSIHLRFKATMHPSATATQIRMIIFRWKQDAPSSVTSILQSASPISFKTETQRYQSNILFDKVFNLNTDRPEMFRQMKIKYNEHVGFNEANVQPTSHAPWILLLSDEATNVPAVSYFTRMYYTDS